MWSPKTVLAELLLPVNLVTIRQTVWYNVTLRRVRATIVTLEKQIIIHTLSVCLYPQVSNLQCACAILSSQEWHNLGGKKFEFLNVCLEQFSF